MLLTIGAYEKAEWKVGDSVKVTYQENDEFSESFWLTVTEVGTDTHKGEVDNMLIMYDMPLGYELEFKTEHVRAVFI